MSRVALQSIRNAKRFRCKRGHEQVGEYRLLVFSPTGKQEYESPPLCRRCYVERLTDDCETTEIVEAP